jgi:hypothetical protein
MLRDPVEQLATLTMATQLCTCTQAATRSERTETIRESTRSGQRSSADQPAGVDQIPFRASAVGGSAWLGRAALGRYQILGREPETKRKRIGLGPPSAGWYVSAAVRSCTSGANKTFDQRVLAQLTWADRRDAFDGGSSICIDAPAGVEKP